MVFAFVLLSVLGGSAASAASQADDQPPFLSEGTPSPEVAAEPTAAALLSNFQESTEISGLTFPTVVRFASDGRVFVAEKSGLVKVFSSLSDTTPTIAADLRTAVDDYWDRGLLGLALDPNFPASSYLYLLYTYDAPIGGTAPRWNDACPTPPGPTTDGCVVSGRLSRIQLAGDLMTGSEQVLINGWCQQYPSHSIGDLAFGPDGKLYVSGGEGASFTFIDYGQGGGSSGSPTPRNPCGDPPGGVGGAMSPPTAKGGALRSQSLGRAAGEPVLLDGSVLRVDPTTGAGLPDNPNGGSSDANKRRVIAHGLRNPFRFAFRPGTGELWVGDVGSSGFEEINLIPSATGAVRNFGWPCYEGGGPQPSYQSAGLNLCTALYGAPGSVVSPYFAYQHLAPIVQGESCPEANGASISGLAFYTSGAYPAAYHGGLFFVDHSRNCIWAMPLGANGLPDTSAVQTFVTGAANPVDIETGPGGDLFYVDFEGGTIRRISYAVLNGPDKAAGRPATASTSYDAALTPEKANDSNSLTRWSSSFADNQWWRVDLGSAQQVDAVSLNWESAYASSYKIQVSSDGSAFTDVATVSNSEPGWKTTSFPVVAARYVRVLGVTRAVPYWGISFWDAQVFGPSGGGVPVNVSPPLISGFAGRGQTLSASTGAWSGSPSSFAYQWQRCDSSSSNCQSIAGATLPTYSLVGADVGQTVRVGVTASNQAGSSTPAYSATTGAVLPDKAAGRPATASTSYDAALTPEKANDSNSLTRWSSSFADNQWWRVDLGSAQQVDAVSLNWESAYASSYKIQVSSDGSAFTDVATVSNSEPGWKTTSFPVVAARYVRVLGVTRAVPYWGISFWDAQVFGPAGSGSSGPTPTIDTPASTLTWRVGDAISFSGHATDPAQGPLPPSALTWRETLHHCTTPSDCHAHVIQTFPGTASGSFNAPDHEYPSWIELQLTATNSSGLSATTSVRLDPKTVVLSFATNPTGLTLTVGSATSVTPFTRTVIVNSVNSLSAPVSQTLNGTTYQFATWSDNGAATHTITAPATAQTYTANYQTQTTAPTNITPPNVSGPAREGRTLTTTNGSWSGTAPISFAYQWRRCDAAGANCTDIAGATAQTYTITVADVGSRIRSRVIASNSAGTAQADSSPTSRIKG